MTISLGTAPLALTPGLASQPDSQKGLGSFADAIGAAVSQVETAQSDARTASANLLVGGQGDVHNVALAAQRAELSLEMFLQVRNKFVQAYQEIMRMPM